MAACKWCVGGECRGPVIGRIGPGLTLDGSAVLDDARKLSAPQGVTISVHLHRPGAYSLDCGISGGLNIVTEAGAGGADGAGEAASLARTVEHRETWQEALAEHEAWLRLRTSAVTTVRARLRTVRRFFQHFRLIGLGQVEPRHIEAWAQYRVKGDPEKKIQPCKNITVNQDIVHLSVFFKWAKRSERITRNPCENWVELPDDCESWDTLAEQQVADMIGAAMDDENAENPRHSHHRSTLYVLLFTTAVRESEARRLTWAEVDLNRRRIVVNRKQKNRTTTDLPLNAEAVAWLKEWRDHCRPRTGAERVFEKFPGWRVVRDDMAAAGISVRGKFHTVRKACNTSMLARGVKLAHAQKIMRHRDPKLTMNVYADGRLMPLAQAVARLPKVGGKKSDMISLDMGHDMTEDETMLALEEPTTCRDDDARPLLTTRASTLTGDGRVSQSRRQEHDMPSMSCSNGGSGDHSGEMSGIGSAAWTDDTQARARPGQTEAQTCSDRHSKAGAPAEGSIPSTPISDEADFARFVGEAAAAAWTARRGGAA